MKTPIIRAGQGIFGGRDKSVSYQERALRTPEELRPMEADRATVLVPNAPGFEIKKVAHFKDLPFKTIYKQFEGRRLTVPLVPTGGRLRRRLQHSRTTSLPSQNGSQTRRLPVDPAVSRRSDGRYRPSWMLGRRLCRESAESGQRGNYDNAQPPSERVTTSAENADDEGDEGEVIDLSPKSGVRAVVSKPVLIGHDVRAK